MARDLIPPPSPAGRPAPDPDQAGTFEPVEERHQDAAAAEPLGPSQFRGRFGFLTGLLAGCGVAAAALLVVLLGTGDSGRKPDPAPAAGNGLAANWSPWHPRATDVIGGAEEIADKLGGAYKDAKKKNLARVKGGLIALNTIPIRLGVPSPGERYTIVPGLGVQYTLSGFGKGGRLVGTEPSSERRRLLRREALELSLYSFRYLPDVEMVVALLPPAPKTEQVHLESSGAAKAKAFQKQALFWRRNELRKQLETPLKTTMALKAPKLDALDRAEARRIDRLTLENLYTYVYHQEQDGSFYLLLDRPS